MAMPAAAPKPTMPTKWRLPMLLENNEAPTWKMRNTKYDNINGLGAVLKFF
ncbi:hypothetical protein DPMN_148309 [Dreissena polymorpha]|uniref:Uncharacterized protein n=1 Tax=Dreissena polymorpha TaxID=45954 RepID=A0A9D4FDT8_DREPO|nr:hypothetical protein DPMN_148309 [Dreissena polymorpha]